MEILGYTYENILSLMEERYGKGAFHARGLWKYLYNKGRMDGLEESASFRPNPALARRLQKDFPLALPNRSRVIHQKGTDKFTLELADTSRIESVVIPMFHYKTLCVSSQVGCIRDCSFCRTAKMGLIRNLSTAEIVSQFFFARFVLGEPVRNMVFMGMGEPLDNLENLLKAVDILTDPRGVNLLKRRISISTCGQGMGLKRFTEIIEEQPEKEYHLIPLSLSLNASDNTLRDRLMPVNRQWPLEELKKILLKLPHAHRKDKLYLEYIVIPGVNDREEDAAGLEAFMEGLTARVNLIPLNAPERSGFVSADMGDMQRFWSRLRERNIPCYTRKRKGKDILAACGQLATECGA